MVVLYIKIIQAVTHLLLVVVLVLFQLVAEVVAQEQLLKQVTQVDRAVAEGVLGILHHTQEVQEHRAKDMLVVQDKSALRITAEAAVGQGQLVEVVDQAQAGSG